MQTDSLPAPSEELIEAPPRIRLLIGESQLIFKVGFEKVLAAETRFHTIAIVDNYALFLRRLGEKKAQIAFLDEDLINKDFTQIEWILNQGTNTRIIITVSNENRDKCLAYMQAGVAGVMPRVISPAQLRECIFSVMEGQRWATGKVRSWIIEDWHRLRGAGAVAATNRIPNYSQREMLAMALLVRGHSNRAIASAANTSEQTIKNVFGSLYKKTGVRGRDELRKHIIRCSLPLG